MNCPKCPGKLQEKYAEEIKVDVCYVCEGIWLDTGELEEIIKRDSRNFDFINLGREELDGREIKDLKDEVDQKTGKCPRCADGTILVQERYEGKGNVQVDVCPNGHGLWLDGGEIHRLRKRGLVNLKDQFDFFCKCIKMAFSKEGREEIKELKERIRNQGQ